MTRVSGASDVEGRVAAYLELGEKLLGEAEGLYARGDLRRAGEKYWEAVLAFIRAAAAGRGWNCGDPIECEAALDRLFRETRDRELLRGMAMAWGMYEGEEDPDVFEVHRQAVLELVKRLRALAAGRGHPLPRPR